MAQQERPTDQDKNRNVNPQQPGQRTGQQEDIEMDEPLRPSQQSEQQQRRTPSKKSGDEGCGCG